MLRAVYYSYIHTYMEGVPQGGLGSREAREEFPQGEKGYNLSLCLGSPRASGDPLTGQRGSPKPAWDPVRQKKESPNYT